MCPLTGKTTTINVLTGMFSQTFGEAYVCGFSIRQDMGQIQQILGVCTQDNVLWDGLTVLEHMQVFAAVRCLLPSTVSSVIEDRLSLVNLWGDRMKKTRKLSGE